MKKKIDPLTRWIMKNDGMSAPIDREIEIKEEKEPERKEKEFSEILADFHNSFVGE